MDISEAEAEPDCNSNSDSDSDTDSDSESSATTGESDNDDQRSRAKRILSRAISGDSVMDDSQDSPDSDVDVDGVTTKQEDVDTIKIEKGDDIIVVIDLTSDSDEDDDANANTDGKTDAADTSEVNINVTPHATLDVAADVTAEAATNPEDNTMFVDQGLGEEFTEVGNGGGVGVKTEEETREAIRAHEEMGRGSIAFVSRMEGFREYIVIGDD